MVGAASSPRLLGEGLHFGGCTALGQGYWGLQTLCNADVISLREGNVFRPLASLEPMPGTLLLGLGQHRLWLPAFLPRTQGRQLSKSPAACSRQSPLQLLRGHENE